MNGFPLFAQGNLADVAAEHAREAGTVAIIIMIAKFLIPVILILAAIFVLFSWFMKGKIVRRVDPGERAIKTRRGKFIGLRSNGFVWMIPFLDRVDIVTLSMVQEPIKEDSLRTHPDEGLFLKLFGSICYEIDGAEAAINGIADPNYQDSADLVKNILASYYRVKDLKALIVSLAKDHLRSVVATKKMDKIFEEKDAIAKDLKEHLSKALQEYGIIIKKTPITDVVLSDDIIKASNRKLVEEKDGAAAVIAATKAGEALVARATKQKEADKLAGEGAAARYEETTRGLKRAFAELTGEELALSAAGAVAFILETERYRMFGNLAAGGNGPSTVFLPYTPGMSDETLSTITAIIGSAPAEAEMDRGDYEGHLAALEEALAEARREERQDRIDLLTKQKAMMQELLLKATDVGGAAAAKALGRIPIFGKKLAKRAEAATQAASAKLEGVG